MPTTWMAYDDDDDDDSLNKWTDRTGSISYMLFL
jgi:hypothetical protein